jgi:hypothetical protein
MGKSKEFVEGFVEALKFYSWMDNSKQLRVGIPGVLLTDAIVRIENESGIFLSEPEVIEGPLKEVEEPTVIEVPKEEPIEE